jgi:hypothetical protein
MVYIPEKDSSFDILELIEKQDLLDFHRQTLNLYCRLAAHGNQKVAHILCSHVDEDQIMHGVKSQCKSFNKFDIKNANSTISDLSGPIRQGIHDFLIAVHLKTHSAARQSTSNEYIIPLNSNLYGKDVFDPESEGRYPHVFGPTMCILPVMKSEPVRKE